MDDLINGTDIVVKFGAVGSEVEVFCSSSCTLNIATATVAAACKSGGNWANNVAGTNSWDVAIDGLYQIVTANGFVDIADLITEGTNDVSILVGQDTTTGDVYWHGKAVLTSCSLTSPDGEIATWTATFVGNGVLTKVVTA